MNAAFPVLTSNFLSIIYTNIIKFSYLGFFQQHLWVLLHIQHDKPDKTTLKQRTAWVQSDQDRCTVDGMSKCDRTLADFPSAERHNCVHFDQLTQTDTGGRGRYPVFSFWLIRNHILHLNLCTNIYTSMVTHLFATGLPGELICVCTWSHLSSNRASYGIQAEMRSRHSSCMGMSVVVFPLININCSHQILFLSLFGKTKQKTKSNHQ